MARQWRYYLIAVLSLMRHLTTALAKDDENSILYPDVANLTFHYLDTVDVAFTTNYDTPWMYLYCLDSAGSRQEIIYYSPSDVEGKTVLPVQLQSHTEYTGSTCWFNLVPEQPESTDDEIGVDSVKFNYVKKAAASSTFGLASTSSASVSTTTPVTTSSASAVSSITGSSSAAAASSAAAQASGSRSGLSTGAKAGIGIAVGLVGIAIITGAAFVFLRKRRRRPQVLPEESKPQPDLSQFAELPQYRQAEELDAGPAGKSWAKEYQGAHELPAYQ